MLDQAALAEGSELSEERVRAIVREEVERAQKRDPASKKAAIIASKGTLDWADPPLNLGASAASSGMHVSIFFTFYGMNIIDKDFERLLRISPVGNPADGRGCHEYRRGYIEGALLRPSIARAGLVGSILARTGCDVSLVAGGIDAWRAGYELVEDSARAR